MTLTRSATLGEAWFAAVMSSFTFAPTSYLATQVTKVFVMNESGTRPNRCGQAHTAFAAELLLLIHCEMGGGRRAETRAGHANDSKYCKNATRDAIHRAASMAQSKVELSQSARQFLNARAGCAAAQLWNCRRYEMGWKNQSFRNLLGANDPAQRERVTRFTYMKRC